MLPTRIHGALDYIVGLALIAAPWVLDANGVEQAAAVPLVLGTGTVLYSLFTDYEAGVVKRIPMRIHLALDAASGVLLAVSPWLFGFSDAIWAPYLGVGLFELVVVALSRRHPSYEPRALTHPG